MILRGELNLYEEEAYEAPQGGEEAEQLQEEPEFSMEEQAEEQTEE